jgi:transcription elongation factor Elf1
MSPVIPHSVEKHLFEMKNIYDIVQYMSSIDLYVFLSQQEHNYVLEGADNFASTVHRLHPKLYKKDRDEDRDKSRPSSIRYSIFQTFVCPYCLTTLSAQNAHSLHIIRSTSVCSNCFQLITFEAIMIFILISHYNAMIFGFLNVDFENETRQAVRVDYVLPDLRFSPSVDTWFKLSLEINEKMKQLFITDVVFNSIPFNQRQEIVAKVKNKFFDLLQQTKENFSYYSMDLIKGMYRQLDFINKVCSNFNYWKSGEVIFTSISRYEKYIRLMTVTNFIISDFRVIFILKFFVLCCIFQFFF